MPIGCGRRRLGESMHAMMVDFISGVATPHVNLLLGAMHRMPMVSLRVWYAQAASPLYKWHANLTNAVVRATVYGNRLPSVGLVRAILARSAATHVPIVVGWSNPTTRLLIPALVAAMRPFYFFTDCPDERREPLGVKGAVKSFYRELLRSHATILAVGRMTVDHFRRRGFRSDRVFNLPLPVSPVDELAPRRRAELRRQLGVPPGTVMLASGSRLVVDKGFDILIDAIAALSRARRQRLCLVIVGQGPEEENLKAQVVRAGLKDRVRFLPWMEFRDFEDVVAAADLAVHPSRFDPYGGTTLTAFGCGTPVVASASVGSAVELVEEAETGFLYPAEDARALEHRLTWAIDHPGGLQKMRARVRQTASRYAPSVLAEGFLQNVMRATE